ncbi:diguanylate cyclase domain-containing protein [Mycolicibacterium sphagni]|uniref:diguanylate cyclase domain-containing protein n=1 Tax=Mycolicibacterium sphagni TaxID=1786 RepID=UPI0021F31347|nr:diguanylate cyclase [Mycolicibacterium sphagni]MCV7178009.1 diguanylate cyclase [Mycolicibacterium sphagni]
MAPADPSDPAEELRRLRLLFDSLPAMIGYWDRQLRNVFANHSYFDYVGLTPDQMHGKPMVEITGATVFEQIRPYVDAALAGEPQIFQSAMVDTHRTQRHFQTSYIPDVIDGEVRGFIVQAIDVTARVEAEEARDEALRLFQLRMANAPFGEAVLTTTGHALMVNPALCQLVGCTSEDLAGSTYRDFVHPDELAAAMEQHRRLVAGEVAQISAEHRYLRPDGTTIWVQRNAVLAPGHEYGVEDVIIAQFQDVTARRVAEGELALLVGTDRLTGLYNRHALVGRIEEHQCGPVGLIFIDLDGFKQVNDMHGHAAGDMVLVEVARRLKDAVSEPNSVYRLGGDEFVVLVPGASRDAVVADLAATVCAAMTGQYPVAADDFHLTASVGWTHGPADDAEELIGKADVDMYRHKARLRESAW